MKKDVEVVNLTKVPIKFMALDGSTIVLKPGKPIVANLQRVDDERKAYVGGYEIKVNNTILRSISNLPDEKDGVIYLVPSFIYFCICHLRNDVYCIDEPVRGEHGVSLAKAISRQQIASNTTDMREISRIINDMPNKGDLPIEALEALLKIKSVSDKY